MLLNIEETFSAFNEVHAVLRAYILYLDQEQLNSYFKNKSLVLERIGRLRGKMIDNPSQLQRLSLIETHLNEKFSYMDKLVLMRKQASMQHYLVLFRSAQGNDLSEKIKSLIQEVKAEEFKLLNVRKNNSKMHLAISVTLLFSGITLNLFSFSFKTGPSIRKVNAVKKRKVYWKYPTKTSKLIRNNWNDRIRIWRRFPIPFRTIFVLRFEAY